MNLHLLSEHFVNDNFKAAKDLLQAGLQQEGAVCFYWSSKELPLPSKENFLTFEECLQFETFQDPKRQSQFLHSRWLLKSLLTDILGFAPSEIKTTIGPLGKPQLLTEQNPNGFQFSLSHTTEVIFIGFSRGHQIGADIEKRVEKKNIDEIAARFFHPREAAWMLSATTPNERLTRFFRLWSMKEAIIKAVGGGVFKNIHQFSLDALEAKLKLNSAHAPFCESEKWQLLESNAIANHSCCVALFG
jgi:4'-phosphopantetheinyl transferase